MPQFTKKPVVVEAVRWSGHNVEVVGRFMCGEVDINLDNPLAPDLLVHTLEGGVFRANPGDWIIKGVKGEFYPCKPDIFAATYDPVDASTAFRTWYPCWIK